MLFILFKSCKQPVTMPFAVVERLAGRLLPETAACADTTGHEFEPVVESDAG